MFKPGEKYKLRTDKSFYTATIIECNENFIIFLDFKGKKIGINKTEIKEFTLLEEENEKRLL